MLNSHKKYSLKALTKSDKNVSIYLLKLDRVVKKRKVLQNGMSFANEKTRKNFCR